MKVVFTENVSGVAQIGDVKNVADGHARNYLFPKGLAVLATPDELRRVESRKRAAAKLLEQQAEEARGAAGELDGISLVFAKRVGSKGNIYGSVSAIAIHQELKRMGHAVEKSMIKLGEPFKQLGTHDVEIELAKGAIATIKVTIEEATVEAKEETLAEDAVQEPAEEIPEEPLASEEEEASSAEED